MTKQECVGDVDLGGARYAHGWWEAMDEPLVYYIVDLFERAAMTADPDAGARFEYSHASGAGLKKDLPAYQYRVSCKHGVTNSNPFEWSPAHVVRKHCNSYGCRCAKFLVMPGIEIDPETRPVYD